MKHVIIRRPHPAWSRILPACCILVFLTLGFGNNVTGLFLQAISADAGLSYGSLSISITIQGIVTLFAVLAVGRVFGRFDARKVTSAAIVCLAACYFLLSMGRTVIHWWLASAVIAFSGAFVSIFSISLILSEWFHQSYSFALGICTAFSGLSGAILNPFVNHCIQSFGWRATYAINASLILLLGLPVTLFLLRFRPADLHLAPYGVQSNVLDSVAAPIAPMPSTAAVLRNPQFYVILVGTLAVSTFYMINQHVVSISASLSLPASVGVQAVTIQMLTITVFHILGNLWMDKGNRAAVCCAFFLTGGIGMLLLLLVRPLSPATFIAAILCYGVGASVLLTIVPVWVRTAFGTEQYAKIYPVFYNLLSIGMAVGGSFSGILLSIPREIEHLDRSD